MPWCNLLNFWYIYCFIFTLITSVTWNLMCYMLIQRNLDLRYVLLYGLSSQFYILHVSLYSLSYVP